MLRGSCIAVVRTWLWALGLLATALAASSCSAQPSQLHQRIEVTIRGGGRNIAARFDFICQQVRDLDGESFFAPVPTSILYVAPDHQALLLTSPQPHESSYCGSDLRNGSPATDWLVPTLVWFDDIRSPSRVDEIGMSSVGAHRELNFPELVAFSHSSTSAPVAAPRKAGRTLLLGEAEPALFSGAPGSGPRMISAARRAAKVEFSSEEDRRSFSSLLGPEVAQGVRFLDLCKLASTADGRAYLSREASRLVASCPPAHTSNLPGPRIRFADPLTMKFNGHGEWLGGGNDGVGSYLRDERSGTEPLRSEAASPFMARASDFWRTNVRAIVWITVSGRRVALPATRPIAYYVEEGEEIVLLLDDSEVMYLNNPLGWNKL